MTVYAGAAGGCAVKVVFGCLVLVGLVTLYAHAVSGQAQLQRVRVVAVTAGNPGLVHLALQEGAMHKDFVLNLPVRVIKALIQGGQQIVLDQQAGVLPIIE